MATESTRCSEFDPRLGNHAQEDDHNLRVPQPTSTQVDQPIELLAELSVLLEQYAPVWYPEDLRHRVLKALRFPAEVLLDVCALLEDHAPSWYTDQQRGRALGMLEDLGLLERDAS